MLLDSIGTLNILIRHCFFYKANLGLSLDSDVSGKSQFNELVHSATHQSKPSVGQPFIAANVKQNCYD